MEDLKDLKAKAYELIIDIQTLQGELREIENKIIEINKTKNQSIGK